MPAAIVFTGLVSVCAAFHFAYGLQNTCSSVQECDIAMVQMRAARVTKHGDGSTRFTHRAWVTLLSGSSVNLTQQVDVQLRSVQKYSGYPHITLVTADVPMHARWKLRGLGSHVVRVDNLSEQPLYSPWWVAGMAALTTDTKTQSLEELAFLEPDAFVNQAGADDIFSDCSNDVDVCATRAPAGEVHSGVLVIRRATERMMRIADMVFSKHVAQQEFINGVLKLNIFQKETGVDVHHEFSIGHLPHAYNPCGSKRIDPDNALILQPCGRFKFEHFPLCAWSKGHAKQPDYCQTDFVDTFQDLLMQSNQCAMQSQHASQCDASSSCHWCGELVRCRPRSQECNLQTPKTLQLVEQYWHRDTEPTSWLEALITPSVSLSAFSDAGPSRTPSAPTDVLVSVIVPACNRNAFVRMTVEQIAAEDYLAKEVIVVDDGDLPISEYMGDELQPVTSGAGNAFGHLQYVFNGMPVTVVRLSVHLSIGAKRNQAVHAARGEIIMHWDEDDLYEPGRIAVQVQPIIGGDSQLTALEMKLFGVPDGVSFRRHPHKGNYFLGSLTYAKSLWKKLNGFTDCSNGEDLDFVERALDSCHSLGLVTEVESVYTRHEGGGAANTWLWGDTVRTTMYGDTIEEVGVPAWVTNDLLVRWLRAEKDATDRGACKVQHIGFAPALIGPQNHYPSNFPFMAPSCCADQLWRCNDILSLARPKAASTSQPQKSPVQILAAARPKVLKGTGVNPVSHTMSHATGTIDMQELQPASIQTKSRDPGENCDTLYSHEFFEDVQSTLPSTNIDLDEAPIGDLGAGMNFKSVTTVGSSAVDLVVTVNTYESEWIVGDPSGQKVPRDPMIGAMGGGAVDGWGRVTVRAGSSSEVNFEFQNATSGAPADLGAFGFTFCGLGTRNAGNVRQSVTTGGFDAYRLAPNSEVEATRRVEGTVQFFAASLHFDNADSNFDPVSKMAKCVYLEFPAGKTGFSATLAATGDDGFHNGFHGGCDFTFAGGSLLETEGVRYVHRAMPLRSARF